MEWSQNGAEWKARKYDVDGNILYTIGEEDNSDQISKSEMKITDKNELGLTQTVNDLFQNKPNPFNPSTEISYNLSAEGFTAIKIYNMIGQEAVTLVNEVKQPGTYKVTFDGSSLSSGMYFYKLIVNGIPADTKRMILMK